MRSPAGSTPTTVSARLPRSARCWLRPSGRARSRPGGLDVPARAQGGGRGRPGSKVRRRRPRYPADRRARGEPDRQHRGRRAARGDGRGRPRRSALAALGGRVRVGELREGEDDGQRRRRRALLVDARTVGSTIDGPPLPEEVPAVALPAVYERLSTGRGEFLAELRPAFPFFVKFAGTDYDNDESAIEKLDEFVRAAQTNPRRVRRERAAADARGQGRLPVRRLRHAVRPRGRRRARLRRRARGERARAVDGRTRHSDRDHPRPTPERDVRPQIAGRSSASAMRSTSRPG